MNAYLVIAVFGIPDDNIAALLAKQNKLKQGH